MPMFIIQLFSDRTIHGLNKADLQLTAFDETKTGFTHKKYVP